MCEHGAAPLCEEVKMRRLTLAFGNIRRSYGMFMNVRSMLPMKGPSPDGNLKMKVASMPILIDAPRLIGLGRMQ